jgi:hypothetical protein
MHLRTPRQVWVLWGTGIALAVAMLPLILYQGRLYYAEGGTSPDGPGMLFLSIVMTSPVWGTAWLLIIAAYLVGYQGEAPLTFGVGATFASILLSMIAFIMTGGFLWLAYARVDFWKPSRIPFIAHLIGCAVYCQYLRAAAMQRSKCAP